MVTIPSNYLTAQEQFVIIFDLGGVLLHEAETNLDSIVSRYGLEVDRVDGKLPKVFNKIFAFAELLFNKSCKKDWILGRITGREIVQKIQENIDLPAFDFFFKNSQERLFIKIAAHWILLPDTLTDLTTINEEGFELVKRCKAQGLRLLILSNWDPESFALIKIKFSELFAFFDESDLIIPAEVGFIKPEIELFDYILQKLNSDEHQKKLFFIDDSLVNVMVAQKCGITSIRHHTWQETEQELLKNGLIIAGTGLLI